ncbi:MAG: adenylate/guanylate cyclase domain-containing protein [Ardenticatenaceae bacterium]|nr:adenylate/guanylate cyclase domain-containing protein [Ardenticatenaceae bacterium]
MTTSSPNLSLAQKLAAFIPQDFRQALANNQTLPVHTTGAVLIADISGFTTLTREFSHQLGRKEGAEAVLAQINPVYEVLIAELYRYGGSVINFVGDAISCWLDDRQGPSAARAVAAALAMQQVMTRFTAVSLPDGRTIPLRIKIAIAAGPVYRLLVGDPAIRQLKTLAGETVQRAAEAGELAQAGDIVVSAEVVDQLKGDLQIKKWRDDRFAWVNGRSTTVSAVPWPDLPADSLSIEQAKSWLLPAVYAHLHSGGEYLGDLRPVTPLMLRFPTPDFDHDPQAAEKLDQYIRWVQRIIHNHGGTLIQLTIGDKGAFLYAPFGAPIAHEDDALRASLAALALHHPPPEISPAGGIQIGLSRGEVWSGACGATVRHTYGVMGDDVNLAARLMVAAAPGQTMVSERMVESARFYYRDVGQFSYKGFPRPIATYELLGEKEQIEKLFKGSIIGRETELRQIQTAIQPIFQGEFAGVVNVLGDAGVGKSHLIYELSQQMGGRIVWLECAADSVRRESLNPFKQLLAAVCHQSANLSPAEKRRRFDEVMTQLAANLPPDHEQSEVVRQELQRTRSVLAALVDLHEDGSLYDQLAPNLRFENIRFAFKNFVRALALIKPVVLYLDDAHWLDEDSLKLIQTLAHNMADIPMAMIFCARFEGTGMEASPPVELPEAVEQKVIVLAELTESGVADLLLQALGRAASKAVSAFLMEATGGNPFFVQQLALDLRERNLLSFNSARGEYELQQSGVSQVPTTLNTVLVSRLDRLGSAVKDVVQTAAVLGREFEVLLLSQMLTNQPEAIIDHIEQAEQAQIWSALTELRYLFRHALMREAAYGMQFKSRLQMLHQVAANGIAHLYADDLIPHAAALAHHYDYAGQIDQARHWYEESALQAENQYANQEAIRAYGRALELTPLAHLTERFKLTAARSEIYKLIGERDAQRADVELLVTLAEESENPELLIEAYFKLISYFSDGNETEKALANLEKTFLLNQELRNKTFEIRGNMLWAKTLWQSGQYEAAREKFEAAYSLAQAADPALEAEILSGLSIVCGISGDVQGAVDYAEKALILHRQSGNRLREATTLNSLGIQARRQGNYSEAEVHYETGYAILQELGYRFGILVVSNNLALVWLEQGQYERARVQLMRSIAISREIEAQRNKAWAEAHLALVLLRLGDVALAKLTALEAVASAEASGDPDVLGYATLYLGHALAGAGEMEKAAAAYQQSMEKRRELGQTNLSLEPMAGLIAVASAQGTVENAQKQLESIVAHLEEDPTLSGTNEPFRVHLIAYNGLSELRDKRANLVLERAHTLLQKRAAKISNPASRRSFLEDVLAHSEIVALFRLSKNPLKPQK